MKRLFDIAAVAVSLWFCASANAETLYYGSRVGMEVTIVSKSDLGSLHAKIVTKHTRENATTFCRAYVGKVTAECIDEELKVALEPTIQANCKTGKFTVLTGEGYRFAGANPHFDPTSSSSPKYLILPLNEKEPLEDYSATGYRTALEQFKALCPTEVGASAAATQDQGLVPRVGEGPSFDCRKAKTAAARLICADGELARLDGELGAMFQRWKTKLAGSDRSQLMEAQRSWIRDRNLRCGLDGKSGAIIEVLAQSKPCMANEIRKRIVELNSLPGSERQKPPVAEVPAAAPPTIADHPSAIGIQMSAGGTPVTPSLGSVSHETIPIDFVGDWCSPFRDKGASMYTLPSWTEGGKCTDILSIDKYGFYFNSEQIRCEPVNMQLREDTAPSGTAYMATVTARCQPDGPATAGKLRNFEFSRYKGNLTVTTNGGGDQSTDQSGDRSNSRFTSMPTADRTQVSGPPAASASDLIRYNPKRSVWDALDKMVPEYFKRCADTPTTPLPSNEVIMRSFVVMINAFADQNWQFMYDYGPPHKDVSVDEWCRTVNQNINLLAAKWSPR